MPTTGPTDLAGRLDGMADRLFGDPGTPALDVFDAADIRAAAMEMRRLRDEVARLYGAARPCQLEPWETRGHPGSRDAS